MRRRTAPTANPTNSSEGARAAVALAPIAPTWAQGSPRHTTHQQPDDDEAATARTIALMQRHAIEDSGSPIIQAAAEIATRGARSMRAQAEGIFRYVKARIVFQQDADTARLAGLPDPDRTELLIRPLDLIQMERPAGDCDDYAQLTAALLLARGIEPAFRTIEAEPSTPGIYSHVYCVALLPEGALAMDTSHGPRPGWEAPPTGKAKTWRFPTLMQQLGAVPTWAQDLIKLGAETGASIASARYGQPPAGTYRQGADGSVFYRQQPGEGPLQFPTAQFNSGSMTWLIVAGIAVVAVLALSSKR